MFWSDPNLYGATLPYKDVNALQTPYFAPWQNIPRFMPTNYGFVPPYFGTLPQHPFLRPEITPFLRPEAVTPFFRPETVPFMNINPMVHNVGWNLPIQNLYRPFTY